MFTTLWRFIRQVSGDDAYERYLDHHKRTHPDTRPLDRKLFFKREQEKKWSGINRCC